MTTFRICSERIHRSFVQVVNIIWPVETELYHPLQGSSGPYSGLIKLKNEAKIKKYFQHTVNVEHTP